MHTSVKSVKSVELLKHFKIKEAAPTCFGLQRNHHQGANSQYLAKNYTLGSMWLHRGCTDVVSITAA
jgi:hypothetical protein